MMSFRNVLFGLGVLLFAVSAFADRNCKYDNPNAIKTKPPSEVIAEGQRSFATGRYEAILGKGGVSGAFLWTHFHGRHNDRTGSTRFRGTVLIRDANNYYYYSSPPLDQKVSGVFDKPERHRHCYGQWDVGPEVATAFSNGVELFVEVVGVRENKGFFGDFAEDLMSEINKYLTGELDSSSLLMLLNAGG